MKRLVGVLFCLILVSSVLLPSGIFGSDSGEVPSPFSSENPSSDDWFVPYERLPEDIKVILEEEASPAALESIQRGDYPREELIQDWMGQEEFVGDVYPVYHSEGVVYIFRGSGEVIFPSGGGTGVTLSEEDSEDCVTVGEAWSEQAYEALYGKRELITPDEPSPESATRIYAGIATPSSANKYFGVMANVNFPQFVDPPGGDFNIYTTHVSLGGNVWFESVVGQYENPPWPECNFYVTWGSPVVIVYSMTPTPGSSHKDAQIKTRYWTPEGYPWVAYMWVYDLDIGSRYYRYEPRDDNRSTYFVDLVQEQIRNHDLPTPTATFKPTYINKGGTEYVSWNRLSVFETRTIEDYPMQHQWISWWTCDFYTWCEED